MRMHLIVEQYGTFVSKHQGRLRVEQDKQRLAEVPIMHLEQVLICSNGVGISSDVVRVCAEEGIPIHFLNGTAGDDYSTLFASGLTGMALTKRAQLCVYEDARGLTLAKTFASGKIQSQANMLRYAAKYRKEADPDLHQGLLLAATEVLDGLPARLHLSHPAARGGDHRHHAGAAAEGAPGRGCDAGGDRRRPCVSREFRRFCNDVV